MSFATDVCAIPVSMETSSEASSKTLLDLWGVSDDDVKRYRGFRIESNNTLTSLFYERRDINEKYLCTVSSLETVSGRKLNSLDNSEPIYVTRNGAQDKFEAHTAPSNKRKDFSNHFPPVHHTQSIESNTTELANSDQCLQLDGQDESAVIDICDWCHCMNELRLSWCENCGRVISKEQQHSTGIHLLNCGTQVLDSSYHGNTKTNPTLLSYPSDIKTSKCTQLQAQCDSYQRHWKKSSYYSWIKPSSSVNLVNKVDGTTVSQLSKLYHCIFHNICTLYVHI